MPRIPGHFEWDDDDLTPGNRREGGLSDNLYDSEGDLKGRARFVPGEPQADVQPEVIYEPDYIYDDEYERRRAREREDNAELAGRIVRELLILAAPHAKRLWIEKAMPAIRERRARRAARKALKAAAKKPVVVEGELVDSSQELAVASEQYKTDMTSSEAQARYLAALAARAFSDEQMKLVANANIVDGDGLAELQHTLAELPPERVARIIEAVEADPSILSSETLADLGKILGVERSEVMPIEEPRDQ